jgi:hypothetical protein
VLCLFSGKALGLSVSTGFLPHDVECRSRVGISLDKHAGWHFKDTVVAMVTEFAKEVVAELASWRGNVAPSSPATEALLAELVKPNSI